MDGVFAVGDELRVDPGEIAARSRDVGDARRRLQIQLDDLGGYVRPLVDSWTGAAAEHYAARQAQWDSAAGELADVLELVGRALGDAAGDFGAAEDTNRRRWD